MHETFALSFIVVNCDKRRIFGEHELTGETRSEHDDLHADQACEARGRAELQDGDGESSEGYAGRAGATDREPRLLLSASAQLKLNQKLKKPILKIKSIRS